MNKLYSLLLLLAATALQVTNAQSLHDTMLVWKGDDTARHGIYRTADDFVQNNISDLTPTDAADRLFVDMDNHVVVLTQGKKSSYAYGSISGFYKDGYRYRAYGDKKIFGVYGYYKIIDDSGLVLYVKTSVNHKSGSHTWFYYSNDVSAPIRRLTTKNLKEDFRDCPAFTAAAGDALRDDTFLSQKEGMPYLNYLYKTMVAK